MPSLCGGYFYEVINFGYFKYSKKVIPYIKEAAGYVLCHISSQAVEMDDGTLLQDKIESMDSEIDGKANTSHTHTATQITGLTASRAMVSDGSGHPAVSNVTATELNYLDGATSNIQNQINTLNSNLMTKIQYREIQVEIGNGNNLPEGGFSSGAVDVSTEYPSAKKVVAIGGRRSGTQYVCNATIENNTTMYCNAVSAGVYYVTIIGFY